MISRFFGSEKIQFEFTMPVAQAMQNLSDNVAAPGVQLPVKSDSMVGGVTDDATYIFRSVSGSRNSFRPTFYGNFSSVDNKTILTGEITLNRVIQKFIVLWCTVVSLVAIWTLLTVLNNPSASYISFIYIVFMLVVCIVFFRMMIKKSNPDYGWLKQEISRSVNGR